MSSIANCSICSLVFTADRVGRKMNSVGFFIKVDYPTVETTDNQAELQTVRHLLINSENFDNAWRRVYDWSRLTKVKAGPGKGRVRHRPRRQVRYSVPLSFKQFKQWVPINGPIKLVGDWKINSRLGTIEGNVVVVPDGNISDQLTIRLAGYQFDARRNNSDYREFRLGDRIAPPSTSSGR